MLKKSKISPGGGSGPCAGVSTDDDPRTELTYLGVGGATSGPSSAASASNAAVEEVGWFERWRRERQVNVTVTLRKRLNPQENSKILYTNLYIFGLASRHEHGTFVGLFFREIL